MLEAYNFSYVGWISILIAALTKYYTYQYTRFHILTLLLHLLWSWLFRCDNHPFLFRLNCAGYYILSLSIKCYRVCHVLQALWVTLLIETNF